MWDDYTRRITFSTSCWKTFYYYYYFDKYLSCKLRAKYWSNYNWVFWNTRSTICFLYLQKDQVQSLPGFEGIVSWVSVNKCGWDARMSLRKVITASRRNSNTEELCCFCEIFLSPEWNVPVLTKILCMFGFNYSPFLFICYLKYIFPHHLPFKFCSLY